MHVLTIFTAALIIAVATPGPGILAVVSCALGHGFRDAVAMACGIIVGDLIYFSLAVAGMAALAHSMGGFFLIVKLAGAAYLVWIGLKLWWAKGEIAINPSASAPSQGFKRSVTAGLTVTLSNPKTIAFYAGLLPAVINLDQLSREDAVIMGMIVIAVVGGIPTLYALMASRARRFFDSTRRMKLMNRTAGTIMIGAGVAVASR